MSTSSPLTILKPVEPTEEEIARDKRLKKESWQ